MVQYTAMVLSVAVLCSVALLCQASPVDWWESEFAREKEKEILEDVAARIISELESTMMIQQNGGETCSELVDDYFFHINDANPLNPAADHSVTFSCRDGFFLFVSFAEDININSQYKRANTTSLKYGCPYSISIKETGYPRCFRLCPELDDIGNGTVNYTYMNYLPGDRATYYCVDNHVFKLDGRATRTCSDTGDWRPSKAPKCILRRCPLVNPIRNGDIDADKSPIGGGYPVDTVVTYTCDIGYLLRGEDTRICLSSEKWDRPEPSCEPIVICPLDDLPITNGEFSPSGDLITGPGGSRGYGVGTVVNYRCTSDHFELQGESSIICQESGEWSHPPPRCIPLCPMLEDKIVNGYLDNPTNRRPGAEATYSCNTGPGEYVLEGSPRTCTEVAGGSRAMWLPGDEPKCIPLCPMLDDKIVNGYLDNPTNRRPGAEATYSCNNGPGEYVLEGSPRTCTEVAGGSRATWSPGDEPKCIPLCPELPNAIGNVTVNRPTNRRPGAMATYSCRKDVPGEHVLDGPETKTCTEDADGKRATWLPSDDPKCVPLCPEPRLPTGDGYAEGGVSLLYGHRKPGDVASYTCKRYAELVGPETRTCGEDGKWSGSDPYCIPIICSPDSLPITDGEFSPSRGLIRAGPGGRRGYGVDTVITYTCTSDRFELQGESRRTCLESGQWDHPRPSCVANRCPELKLSGNPESVYETKKQIERDRPKNYRELLIIQFFKKEVKGDPVPYELGSKAYLTCMNGWKLLPGSDAVQTCISENGDLVWTKPGVCVYKYSITRITGGTG